MPRERKQKIKQIISCTLGIPAAIVAVSEPNEIEYWWVSVLAAAVVVGILLWNRNKFNERCV